jgi:hypothetical protein
MYGFKLRIASLHGFNQAWSRAVYRSHVHIKSHTRVSPALHPSRPLYLSIYLSSFLSHISLLSSLSLPHPPFFLSFSDGSVGMVRRMVEPVSQRTVRGSFAHILVFGCGFPCTDLVEHAVATSLALSLSLSPSASPPLSCEEVESFCSLKRTLFPRTI